MRSRRLLYIGIAAIAGSLFLGVTGLAMGQMSGHSPWTPGAMMGRIVGGGGDIGMDRAVQIAKDVAASYSRESLVADEVIEFSENYYASIREADTGIGAFEILIDRSSGRVVREPGPDMMWSTKYSTMGGGMMGGFRNTGSGPITVTAQHAQDIAQRWLDANQAGAQADSPDPFYGYFTVDFQSKGTLVGMLSVNGYSGEVWFHSWHGTFIQMRDLGT